MTIKIEIFRQNFYGRKGISLTKKKGRKGIVLNKIHKPNLENLRTGGHGKMPLSQPIIHALIGCNLIWA